MSSHISHQIFSLARDWSKRVMKLNMAQLNLGSMDVTFPLRGVHSSKESFFFKPSVTLTRLPNQRQWKRWKFISTVYRAESSNLHTGLFAAVTCTWLSSPPFSFLAPWGAFFLYMGNHFKSRRIREFRKYGRAQGSRKENVYKKK